MSQIAEGRVVAAFGRHYSVELPDRLILDCVPRGKKSEVACGDYVEVMRSSDNQGVIERILPRRSLLHRSVAHREKLIAANVTQIVVVVATEPSFSDELLARCLVAAHDQQLATLIVLNKCDLPLRSMPQTQLQPYRDIGYRVLELCAKENVQALRELLQGHTSVLVGQSGMGKSTLINALTSGGTRSHARHFHRAGFRQTHHHTCTDVSPRYAKQLDRLPRRAGLWPASPDLRRYRRRFHRVCGVSRAVPVPQLPPFA